MLQKLRQGIVFELICGLPKRNKKEIPILRVIIEIFSGVQGNPLIEINYGSYVGSAIITAGITVAVAKRPLGTAKKKKKKKKKQQELQ